MNNTPINDRNRKPDEPLSVALANILDPLNLDAVVESEVLFARPKTEKPVRKVGKQP